MPKHSRNNNNGGKRKTQRTKSRSANRVPAAGGQLARLAAARTRVPSSAAGTFGFSRPAHKNSKNKKPE